MLSTLNRRRDYKTKGTKVTKRAANFMPRFDGLYIIVDTTLDMPNAPNLFPTFRTPSLGTLTTTSITHHELLKTRGPSTSTVWRNFWSIHRKIGLGFRYLVHFKGQGPENDR